MKIDPRGILLTDKVDIAWLKKLEPQYFKDFIKFDILLEENKVFFGMQIHSHTNGLLGGTAETREKLYGGNLFFEPVKIVWESGLNLFHNNKLGATHSDLRLIEHKPTIKLLDAVLQNWVKL
jgi:hypothetical protein